VPSINHYIEIHGQRRIRINTCEGEVSLTDEIKADGRWLAASGAAQILLTREQARRVAQGVIDAMRKNF
jgi:hypothetical protein